MGMVEAVSPLSILALLLLVNDGNITVIEIYLSLYRKLFVFSGAGTNLKVGAPVRNKSGGTDPARSAGNFLFFGRAPSLFGFKNTVSRFDERFRDGQYTTV